MTVGERLREIRTTRHKTLEEVALAINSSPTSVSKYESGKVKNIPQSKLMAIADYLEVSPFYILGVEDEENASPLVLSISEQLLIEDFRKLPPLYQQAVANLAKDLANAQNPQEEITQLTL